MESVGLDEWPKAVELADYTARYMKEGEGERKRSRCVQNSMKGTDVEAKDNDGQSALMRAAYHGDRTSVQLLLEMGCEIDAKSNLKVVPLAFAASQGHVSCCRAPRGLSIITKIGI